MPSTSEVWARRRARWSAPTLAVGDKVAYSRAFLQSTAQHSGPVPFARGFIREVTDLGGGCVLCTVAWIKGSEPWPMAKPRETRVNVKNLVRHDRIHLEPV